MGCCCAFVGIGVLTVLAYLIKKIYSCLFDIPKVPNVDENYWWGPGDTSTQEDTSIKPFKINVPEKDLADLKQRLSVSRPLTAPLEGIQHQYGLNTNILKAISEYWQTKYDWRVRESFLNQYQHYTTKIQGLNITFLHIKPTESDGLKVVPLLLLHGWPGSIREFYETIPRLIKPDKGRNFVFELVIPNLPGYGFSEGASRPGLDPTGIAVIFKNLMKRLNFDKFYVQGGDWGSEIGTHMAILYPKNILGLHLNMAFLQTPMATLKRMLGSLCPSLIVSEKYRSKMYPLKNLFFNACRESGYMHIQSTKPDTVGVALNDSPLGLAAYIIEKFVAWTNLDFISREDGGLSTKFSYEKLLDNVMIYWINNSITTSMRLYSETFALCNPNKIMSKIPVEVPFAYSQFGDDMFYLPESLIKEKYKNLIQYTNVPTGGHFAAFEEPDLFADDVWNAVEKFENYHKM